MINVFLFQRFLRKKTKHMGVPTRNAIHRRRRDVAKNSRRRATDGTLAVNT